MLFRSITTSATDTASVPAPIKGKGGQGGVGYIRLEDVDGLFGELAAPDVIVVGKVVTGQFAPTAEGNYPGRDDIVTTPSDNIDQRVPMVVNTSVVYSKWFNALLETPTYVAVYDDPATVGTDGILGTADDLYEGTYFNDYAAQSGGQILIEARTAPNDTDPLNSGHPNLFQATGWFPLDQLAQISDRRFLQFRITFTLPLNYTFDLPRPYVEYLQINIELQ